MFSLASSVILYVLLSLIITLTDGSPGTLQSWNCTGEQRWELSPATSNFSYFTWLGNESSQISLSPLVLTLLNGSGALLGVLPRSSSPQTDQLWSLTSNGLLISAHNAGHDCVAASAPIPGLPLHMAPCNASDARQLWIQLPTDGSLQQASLFGKQCADIGSRLTCASPSVASFLFCNASASPVARAADLSARLNVYDLQAMLGGWYNSPGVPRLGINSITISEALHGLGDVGCNHPFSNQSWTNSGCATSFPHATLLGAAFNKTLWAGIGDAIGVEARAANSGLLLYTPDINTSRDQRFGRAQEVPGEDPLLTGMYAKFFVSALQRGIGGSANAPLRAVATCKHWSAYDVEGRTGANDPTPTNYSRHTFDANISRKDLAEYFFPPMHDCVSSSGGGGALSVMSSINAVNGIPGAANINFTVAQLRKAWNFSGYVTSDCGTISDLLLTHRFVNSTSAAVAAGMAGGTDVNCGHFYNLYMADALEQGLVSLEELQDAGGRFLRTVFELGLAENASSSPFASWGSERVDSPAHRALALEGAIQGIVLLRNDNNTLPLNLSTISSLALVGPHLNASSAMLSSYVGSTRLDSENTPLLRLSARAAAVGHVTVSNALGVPTAHSNDTSGIAAAVALASAADVTIAFLGLDQVLEREGLDRDSLALPSAQAALLTALLSSGCRRVIVVLLFGGAISESAQGAQALVAAFYPGELGGEAIASLLLGEVAFSGRLPFTVPTLSWAASRAITDMHLAPHLNENGRLQIPGATNWYMNNAADTLFPFGFGLSLTEWDWAWPEGTACSNGEISIDAEAWARSLVSAPTLIVRAANGGSIASGISALGFISSGIAGEPLQKLFDFDRSARVYPGDFVDLTLQIPSSVAGIVDKNGTRSLQPGSYTVRVGGHAASGGVLCTLKVTGQPAFIDELAF